MRPYGGGRLDFQISLTHNGQFTILLIRKRQFRSTSTTDSHLLQYIAESPLKLRLFNILSVNYIKCLQLASKQNIPTFF